MSGINYHLDKISEYISQTKNDCTRIQEQQIAMEKAYTKLGRVWADTIYVDVGVVLYKTAKSMAKMYEGMKRSVKAATAFYQEFSKFERTGTPISGTIIPDYKFSLKEVPNMPKNQGYVDSKLLEQFLKCLQDYAEHTEVSLINIKRRYDGIAPYWSGDQYKQFGIVISSVESEIRKQLIELDSLGYSLGNKYQWLVKIEKSKINKMN